MLRSTRLIQVIRGDPLRQFVDWSKMSIGMEDFVEAVTNPGQIKDYFLFGPQARRKMLSKIEAHCDKEYGGKSESNWLYIDEDTPNDRALRFHGFHRKYQTDPTKKNQPTKAYNALKIDYNGKYDLDQYQGLEIVLRSSKPWTFTFSVYCTSLQEFDCLQVDLEVKHTNVYQRIYVPFDAMQYSTLIDISDDTVQENPNVEMTGLGFLIKNPPPDSDDFCIDLQSVTAMCRMPDNTARSARLFKENYLRNRALPVRND